MAYGAGRRGGYAPPRRGGGNAGYVVAGVFVIGVIVLIVALTSGKKTPTRTVAPPEEPVVAAPPPPPPKSKPPEAAPFPPVDPAVVAQAKEIAKRAAEPAARAKTIYDEGMKAKQAGDDETWQKKMEEASEILTAIQDEWNEMVARMPKSEHYDEEQIANHYVGREATQIDQALRLLAGIKKSIRLR